MKQIYRHEITIHKGELPQQTFDFDTVAIDLEMFNQDDNRLHRPHGDFASLACCYNGKDVYIIFDTEMIADFLLTLNDSLWVFHNAQYDIKQLRRFADIPDRKLIYDTMLIEQIRYSGYYDRFALDDLYRRYCYKYLPKQERKSFSGHTGEMTDEQIFYAACDVVATWEIYQEQSQQLDEDDLYIWENIERPTLWTLLDTGGITVDVEKWLAIAQDKENVATTIYDDLSAKYNINVRSPKQLLEFLKAEGLDIDSTNKASLQAHAKEHPIIPFILSYRKPAKGASTYGKKWIDEWIEPDGKVYTAYRQIGTVTGRFSSSNPAMQTIPVRDEPIYRECFIAEKGNKLIIADWSAQEPRITAFLSQDDGLIDIFNSGKDIYIEIGYKVFGERFGKKDKRRDVMKSLVLGLAYGLTKWGLAERTGYSPDEAQELIDKYFEEFPGEQEYIQEQIKIARKQGYVQSANDRKIWISPYDNGMERNAPNYPIQSTGADCMKIAANQFRKKWMSLHGVNPLRLFVHDEILCEVPENDADEAAKLLEEVMVNVAETIHTGIVGKADVYIGDTWGAKK